MKEIQEILEHDKHEHLALDQERKKMLAEAKDGMVQYFKKNERDLVRRGDTYRKDRRKFLDMMGRTGISSSILKAFPAIAGIVASRQAVAADSKRAVFCYINSGAPNGYWLPNSATEMNLVTEPYASVASVCNFREIDAMVTGHTRASQALGARGYGQPTTDAIVAPVLSANTPFSTMFVGSETSGADVSSFGQPKGDPHIALNDYFSAGAGSSSGPDTSYLRAFAAQQRAIEEIKSKLSMEERQRLQEHVAALEKIENRITTLASGEGIKPEECAPSLPSASFYERPGGGIKMVEHGKLQADILIAGLKCGLTNVATLQLGAETGSWKTFGVDHYGGFSGDSHNSCHAGRDMDGIPISFVECHRYVSQVAAYMIEQLMSNVGPDGKDLIETTVFAQVTCMGSGADHTTPNAPFILATKMPGFASEFSKMNQSQTGDGNTYDFNETIAKGLGVQGNFSSTNTLGLLA